MTELGSKVDAIWNQAAIWAYQWGTTFIVVSVLLPQDKFVVWATASIAGLLLGYGFATSLLDSKLSRSIENAIGVLSYRVAKWLAALFLIVGVLGGHLSSFVTTAGWPREFMGGFIGDFAFICSLRASLRAEPTS